jgi:hypothetical protein
VPARRLVPDVVAHAHRARREDREIGAPLALDAELRPFEARADLVVGDLQRPFRRGMPGLAEVLDLLLAPGLELFRCGCVVAVTVDDHDGFSRLKLSGLRRPCPSITVV